MNPLTTKFMAPDCSGTLPRKQLEWVVNAIPRHRLTLIIAGAGYGKTCLVAQICETLRLRQIWIRPEENHRTPELLAAQIAKGLSLHFPEFQWPDPGRGLNEKPKPTTAGLFADALESAAFKDFFLIVEDCHELNPPACLFFQELLDRFLPFLHLILVGRTPPKMKFSRLAARGQVLRIPVTDLAFSREETAEMLCLLFEQSIPGSDIDLLWHKTRGWVSGLILFHQMVGQRGNLCGTEEAIARLKGCHGLIRDYFKENVYEGLAKKLQQFLLKTAVLTQMDTDFCNEFLQINNARDLLSRLEDQTGFVVSLDRDKFSCHPLFREFLEDRIRTELGASQPRALYTRAARLYEASGQGREALTHHILAGNITDAAKLMNQFARPVIKQDRPLILKSILSVIPARYMDEEPWLQYLQAGYYGLCSQLKPAVAAYEKVLKIFRRQKDEQGECLVLMELAEHYLARGQIRQSEQAYTRILTKNRLDPHLTIIVMGHLIRVLALAGRPAEADKYAAKAVSLQEKLEAKPEEAGTLDMGRAWIYAAQGYRHAFAGNYEKAMALGKKAKQLFRRLGRGRLLFSAYFLISYSCFYLGRFSKGMDAAQEGLALAGEKGITDEFTELLRLMSAKNGLERSGVAKADIAFYQKEIKKSLAYFETRDFPGGMAQGYLVLHRALMEQGDAGEAEKSLRQGIAAVRGTHMPLIRNELKTALSELLLYGGKGDHKGEAIALLKGAEQELLYSGWHIAWISRIFARYYWAHGHRETARKYMVYSLKICHEESFAPWMVKEKDWAVPLLTSLYAMGSMAPYIETLFIQMGPEVIHDLHGLAQHPKKEIKKSASRLMAMIPMPCPPAVTASFFGRFRLFVGDRQIPTDQWKSRKALTLFKYLLAMGSRGYIEKEILMELLWPEEDPRKSSQRFHVALAAVRKTLEPDIFQGMRSAYVKRSGQAYRIEITPKGRVDVDCFTREIRAGDAAATPEKAMDHYSIALTLYKGEFLKEDVYEQWCIRERAHYRDAFLSVLKKTMAFHASRNAHASAISAANNYLAIDPYAEGVVRRLMEYHSMEGNSPMVSRVFQDFSRAVHREFNCGVSEKTRDLFHKLSSPRSEVWDTRMLESFRISGSL